MRRRIGVALGIGLLSGMLCGWYQHLSGRGAGDITWAIRLVPDLFAGIDPYGYSIELTPMAYPLTAGMIALPLAIFPSAAAAGVFFGSSSALLAFGLTRDGTWWRLLTFLSYPYLLALGTVQWSPLLLSVALFPTLLPLTMAKPHIGLPIALTNLTWRRTIACVAFGMLSLALMPDWPLRWVGHQAAPVRYMWPLLTLPLGPLLALALWRWRDPRARFLLLLSLMPQHRWGYDTLVLWSLPKTPSAALAFLLASWVGCGGLIFGTISGGSPTGSAAAVALWYLPALAHVLWPQLKLRLPWPYVSRGTASLPDGNAQ